MMVSIFVPECPSILLLDTPRGRPTSIVGCDDVSVARANKD